MEYPDETSQIEMALGLLESLFVLNRKLHTSETSAQRQDPDSMKRKEKLRNKDAKRA